MNRKSLRLLLPFVSLCALALSAHAQQQPQRGGLDSMSLVTHAGADASWQLFAPEGAGFSVLVPGTPEEVTKRGRESGQLAAQFRGYELAGADGVKYEFGRTGQLPAALLVRPDFKEEFFAHNVEGLSAALQHANPRAGFKLVAERRVSVAGYEGREYEYAAPGLRSVARVYLVDRAIFALAVSGGETALTADKAGKFLDSFTPVD